MRKVTSEEFHNRFMKTDSIASQLEKFWDEHIPAIPRPNRDQFEKWVHIHGYDAEPLRHAIRSAVRRLTRKPFNDAQHPIQYLSAVALGYINEQKQGLEKKAA
jgi:hypothetical protein